MALQISLENSLYPCANCLYSKAPRFIKAHFLIVTITYLSLLVYKEQSTCLSPKITVFLPEKERKHQNASHNTQVSGESQMLANTVLDSSFLPDRVQTTLNSLY